MTIVFADERSDPSLSPPVESQALQELAATTLTSEGLPDGKSGPTDVLSFPLESFTPGTTPVPPADGPPLHLGDVFICPAVVSYNAASAGVPFADEMALMVVHGLLHLLGYDHVVDSEAEQMEQRERDLLAVVGRVRP